MAVVLNADIFKCKVSHGHSHDGGHGHSHGHSHARSRANSHGYMPLANRKRGSQEHLTSNMDDEETGMNRYI